MVKTSNASYENNIHRVDNKDSKNIIFLAREALISRKKRPKNLGKMIKNKETHCYANLGSGQFNSLVSKSLHYFAFPAC